MTSLTRAASIADFRELARRKLPKMLFEYADGGAYGEVTLSRNVSDFGRLMLRQRVMRDMSQLDTAVHTLGQTFKMPIGLDPVGMAGMYARRGEAQVARAAALAGVPWRMRFGFLRATPRHLGRHRARIDEERAFLC